MYLIQNISADPYQKQSLILPNGDRLVLTFYFSSMFYSWYISSMVHKNLTLNNIRIYNSLNILTQWSNRIPFGIACITQDNREPSLIQDFSSGVSKLYIIDQDEMKTWMEFIDGR